MKNLSNISGNPIKNLQQSSQNGDRDPPKTQCQALCNYFDILHQFWSDLGRSFEVICPPKSMYKICFFSHRFQNQLLLCFSTSAPLFHHFWASKLDSDTNRGLCRKMVFRVHETPIFSGSGSCGTTQNRIQSNHTNKHAFRTHIFHFFHDFGDHSGVIRLKL